MKKSKIVFVVMGMMLSILLVAPKIGVSRESPLQVPMAKHQLRFSHSLSPSRCWRIPDQRYRGNYPAHYFHSTDDRGSPFYLPHLEAKKLLFPYFTKDALFNVIDWLPNLDNSRQKNALPKSNLLSYPCYPAGVREEWSRIYESRTLPGYDVATDLAVDDQGNVYVTGYSTNLPQGMDFYTIKYDASGNQVWAVYYNGDANGDDQAVAIALDDNDNVYVGGTSSGLGSSFDFAVVKYNSRGQQQWVARYNDSSSSYGELTDMIVDNIGNVYLTGIIDNSIAIVKINFNGIQQWAVQYKGFANYDFPTDIEIDNHGNVYVIGATKSYQTTYLFCEFITLKYSADGAQLWEARYSSSDSSYNIAIDSAIDDDENVYVTGTSKLNTTEDFVTIKYDRDGKELWMVAYDGPDNAESDDYVQAMTLDKDGNIYVTGTRYDVDDYDLDFATIKYNADGEELWVSRFGERKETEYYCRKIATDVSGNVYVAGFGDDNGGGRGYLIVKYSPDGSQLWSAQYMNSDNNWAYLNDLAVAHDGEVYVTGEIEGSETGYDFATVKYNSAGIQQWVQQFNGKNSEEGAAVDLVVDEDGNIIAFGGSGNKFVTTKYTAGGTAVWTANFEGRDYNFGNNKSLAIDPKGNVFTIIANRADTSEWNYDFVTIKYDANGVQQWVARYDESEWHETGDRYNIPAAIVTDRSGNAFVTGRSTGKNGGYDIITIKYNPDGIEKWVNRFRSNEDQSCVPTDIAVDRDDNVYVAGSIEAEPSSLVIIKYDSHGKQQWIATYSETKFLCAPLMTLDSWGNIYLVSNKSKYSMLCSLADFDDCIILKYNQNGVRQWINKFSEPNQTLIASDIGVDDWGNVYICGNPWRSNLKNCYVTKKYNADGIELWTACFETSYFWDYPTCLMLDRDGNVYVAGSIGGYGTDSDIAIVKYTPEGKEQWSMIYNDARNTRDRANEMTVDFSGNVYIAGVAEGSHWSNFKTVKFSQTGEDSLIVSEIDGYELSHNIPNPFKKQTVIYYQLPRSSHVTIKIFNSLGQQVAFKDLGQQPEGRQGYYFLGENLPNGIYFFQLKAGDFVKTRKMVMIR